MDDTKDKTINNEHDIGYTSILGDKRTFIDFIKKFVREQWVDEISLSSIKRDKTVYITPEFRKKELDILYKLKINRKDIYFYILLELQSTVDYTMPLRLLNYMIEIWRKYIEEEGYKKERKKDFSLPAIVPMVIYNGKKGWTAKGSFKEIQQGFELFGKHLLDFEYLLFDVNQYKKEELLKIANVMAAVFYIEKSSGDRKNLFKKFIETAPIIKNIDDRQTKLLFRWMEKVIAPKLPENAQREFKKYLTLKVLKEKGVKEVMSSIATQIEEMQVNAKYEGKKEVVIKALQNGSDIDFISKITGLKKTEIESIRLEINRK